MIEVKRKYSPEILKKELTPSSNGEVETKDAINFFSNSANHQLTFRRTGAKGQILKGSYIVYSDRSVRRVLLEMFHGKCAYCESKITNIYNGDIEHFRPKGKVHEAIPVQPGYYWLAADWDNLLFSCPFCNQTNTHKIIEDGKTQEVVLGKLNQFPLETEKFRLNYRHGNIYLSNRILYKEVFDLEESERLLLNPCLDLNIENLFKYNDDGAIIVNEGLTYIEQKKAETSIRVYALHRLNLAQARRERIIQIKSQIKRVENAIKNFNRYINNSDEEKIWFEGIMKDEMRILKVFIEPDQEYAGLARYIINKYFNDAFFV